MEILLYWYLINMKIFYW